MVKWYHVCRVTRYRASVLTHGHVITLADESARPHFTVVKWCRGAMVVWYRGIVAAWCPTTIVAARQRLCARAGELEASIRARSELESCELRAGAATKNLT